MSGEFFLVRRGATALRNSVVWDGRLSYAALGVLAALLSSRPGSPMGYRSLVGRGLGERGTRAALRELDEVGLRYQFRVRTASGVLRTVTVVCDEPASEVEAFECACEVAVSCGWGVVVPGRVWHGRSSVSSPVLAEGDFDTHEPEPDELKADEPGADEPDKGESGADDSGAGEPEGDGPGVGVLGPGEVASGVVGDRAADGAARCIPTPEGHEKVTTVRRLTVARSDAAQEYKYSSKEPKGSLTNQAASPPTRLRADHGERSGLSGRVGQVGPKTCSPTGGGVSGSPPTPPASGVVRGEVDTPTARNTHSTANVSYAQALNAGQTLGPVDPPGTLQPVQVQRDPHLQPRQTRDAVVKPVDPHTTKDSASGVVCGTEDSPPGASSGRVSSVDVSSASGADVVCAGLGVEDQHVLVACLPAWMCVLDAQGARVVAGLLRERLDAGWTPGQIRQTVGDKVPREGVKRVGGLVASRLRRNVDPACAPARLRQAHEEHQRLVRDQLRDRQDRLVAQAQGEPEADVEWEEIVAQVRADMPGAGWAAWTKEAIRRRIEREGVVR